MYKEELKDNLITIGLIVAIIGILAFLGNFMILNFTNKVYGYEESLTHTIYIKSISTTEESSDGFTLGHTTVDAKQYFVCYEEMEDGSLKVHDFELSKTVINATLSKDEKPYAEVVVNEHGEIIKVQLYLSQNVKQTEYNAPNLHQEQLRSKK